MTPLIDATEMYLRTIWELGEEGITPIRARLVERLNLTAPAVSETVARLEEEGLVRVSPTDRTLALTEKGREIAISVMRKHRLAERLLTDVIGLEWEQVHTEACRWEHVISDQVVQRLTELLDDPETCPHGNPIPGVRSRGDRASAPEPDSRTDLVTIIEAAKEGRTAVVRRISEHLQTDVKVMSLLREHDLRPGTRVDLELQDGAVMVEGPAGRLRLEADLAALVYVRVV